MSFGFPAYHTERFSVPGGKVDLRDAVRKTLEVLKWSIRQETSDTIFASASIGLRSWGEKVIISFLPDHSISITSKCKLPTQCVDWGKNRANVNKFVSEMEKHI